MLVKSTRPHSRLKFRTYSLVIVVLITSISTSIWAQDMVPKYTLNLSYYGNNIWNPGFNIGLDYTHGVEEGTNRKGDEYTRQKHYNLDIGFYVDPRSHAGLLIHSGFNHRKFRENKLNFHLGGSPLGIYRSFLYETDEVSDDGEVSNVKLPGRFYYAPTLSLGMGKFFKGVPGTGWFFEIDLTGLVPYNTFAMLLVNSKLGLRVRLD